MAEVVNFSEVPVIKNEVEDDTEELFDIPNSSLPPKRECDPLETLSSTASIPCKLEPHTQELNSTSINDEVEDTLPSYNKVLFDILNEELSENSSVAPKLEDDLLHAVPSISVPCKLEPCSEKSEPLSGNDEEMIISTVNSSGGVFQPTLLDLTASVEVKTPPEKAIEEDSASILDQHDSPPEKNGKRKGSVKKFPGRKSRVIFLPKDNCGIDNKLISDDAEPQETAAKRLKPESLINTSVLIIPRPFEIHVSEPTSKTKYSAECITCEKSMFDCAQIVMHIKDEHKQAQGSFQCRICMEKFDFLFACQNHLVMHLSDPKADVVVDEQEPEDTLPSDNKMLFDIHNEDLLGKSFGPPKLEEDPLGTFPSISLPCKLEPCSPKPDSLSGEDEETINCTVNSSIGMFQPKLLDLAPSVEVKTLIGKPIEEVTADVLPCDSKGVHSKLRKEPIRLDSTSILDQHDSPPEKNRKRKEYVKKIPRRKSKVIFLPKDNCGIDNNFPSYDSEPEETDIPRPFEIHISEPKSKTKYSAECITCEKCMFDSTQIMIHIKDEHMQAQGSFQCRICMKKFDFLFACQNHLVIHLESQFP
ncbi:uncharacterized protein LOC136029943 isoform X2 [Artemia franciscana]|uniref:uncharacterized protein LOC136029943 isoform X2 n=1 Tax=Artemia franciscana TaxID=6661 RepID=UPI0032DB3875